ncbi:hypothetical protein O3P69_000588 [Scylla paramamosain]|uniref:Ig-like domain-containing protein n=1 Tax=Scylla paramamosain TaxID=85552 RepID=A0AAW0UU99_SCYPA
MEPKSRLGSTHHSTAERNTQAGQPGLPPLTQYHSLDRTKPQVIVMVAGVVVRCWRRITSHPRTRSQQRIITGETHEWSFETGERESRDQVTEAWVWLEGDSQPSKMSPGRTRRQEWRVSAVELMFSGEALENRSYSCRGEGEGEGEAAGTKYGRPHVTSEARETDLSLNTLTLTPGTFITVQTPLQHSPSLVFVLIPAGGSSGRSPCTSTQPSPSPPPPRPECDSSSAPEPGQYGVLWRREEERPARKAQCAAASGASAARLNAFLSKWFGSKHARISFPQRASPKWKCGRGKFTGERGQVLVAGLYVKWHRHHQPRGAPPLPAPPPSLADPRPHNARAPPSAPKECNVFDKWPQKRYSHERHSRTSTHERRGKIFVKASRALSKSVRVKQCRTGHRVTGYEGPRCAARDWRRGASVTQGPASFILSALRRQRLLLFLIPFLLSRSHSDLPAAINHSPPLPQHQQQHHQEKHANEAAIPSRPRVTTSIKRVLVYWWESAGRLCVEGTRAGRDSGGGDSEKLSKDCRDWDCDMRIGGREGKEGTRPRQITFLIRLNGHTPMEGRVLPRPAPPPRPPSVVAYTSAPPEGRYLEFLLGAV